MDFRTWSPMTVGSSYKVHSLIQSSSSCSFRKEEELSIYEFVIGRRHTISCYWERNEICMVYIKWQSLEASFTAFSSKRADVFWPHQQFHTRLLLQHPTSERCAMFLNSFWILSTITHSTSLGFSCIILQNNFPLPNTGFPPRLTWIKESNSCLLDLFLAQYVAVWW